jgi:cytochrome c oxidase cbb3-type subunit 3
MATHPSDQDRLLGHDYDGIQEFDNPMPRWWVWIFWATILFAIAYAADVTGTLRGPGRIAAYNAQIADAERRWPAPVAADEATLAALAALAKDSRVLATGKTLFTANCIACHRADAGGIIGPNLTDEYWLHGGSLAEIRTTIFNGVLAKGMPNWGKFLKPDQVNALAVYVASLGGSNPPNPKAPQGDKGGRESR